jgi:acetoin utilization protein AcuB
MPLRSIMQKPVLALTTGQPASDAWETMRSEGVRHAVVLLGGNLVGVVSDRDLGGPNGAVVRQGRCVGDLMQSSVVTAPPDLLVADAVALVRDRHIGCLPIVEDGRVIGIVTRSDLLREMDPRLAEEADLPPPRGAADVHRPPVVVSPNVVKPVNN